MKKTNPEKINATKNSKVFDIVDKNPKALEYFLKKGFVDLKNPLMRNTIARVITIEKACKIHKLDADKFLKELKEFLGEE